MRYFLLLFFLPSLALAGGSSSDDVSWTPPTQYEDGTALPASEIAEYVIRWGTTSGTYPNEIRVNAAAVNYVVPRVPPSHETRCYVMTTVATTGLESVYSAEVCKRRPKPPKPGVK